MNDCLDSFSWIGDRSCSVSMGVIRLFFPGEKVSRRYCRN